MNENYYDLNQLPQPQSNNDERQFNLPGYLFGQFFGSGQDNTGPSPGGGVFPGWPGVFPGGGAFPGTPGGFPGGGPFPGGPGPGSYPGGGGQQAGPPTSPPPNFIPEQSQFQTLAVDPGGIRGCLFRFTYIWLRRGGFWFYPTFVGRTSVAGYRWSGFRWVYFGIDLNQIQSFQCF